MVKIIGKSNPHIPWESCPKHCSEPVWRHTHNPIAGRGVHLAGGYAHAAGVVPMGKGFAGVFARASRALRRDLYAGWSQDGIRFEIEEEPLTFSGKPEVILREYRQDPRVCWIEDRYYLTWCNGYHGPAIGVGWTKDFRSFHQLNNALLPQNNQGVLFPRRIGGLYGMLSCPAQRDGTLGGGIFFSQSPDMVFWGQHRFVMGAARGEDAPWQSAGAGPGAVPIETEAGWLLFYYGVPGPGPAAVHRMGVALLDLEMPWKVVSRCSFYLLEPEMPYETWGNAPQGVLPCAALTDADTGRIALYYGCGGGALGLAFTTVDAVLAYMQSHPL